MMLAQGNQLLIVVEHLRETLEVIPVEMVDGIGRLKGVMHAFLVTEHLLTAEDERNALTGEHRRLSEQVETYQFIGGNAR